MDMLSDTIAGWLQGNVLLPLMYQFGLMQWEDICTAGRCSRSMVPSR